MRDLKSDSDVSLESNEDGYIIRAKVNYPNNEELVYEKLYFDKSSNLKKVEVFNSDDMVKIKVDIKDINYKAKLSENDFKLDELIDTEVNNATKEENSSNEALNSEEGPCGDNNCENNNCLNGSCENSKTTGDVDTIVYPLYIPLNTHLSNADTVMMDDGSRVILSFTGDKNFVIVEETASAYSDFEVIPVFGDPLLLNESIGVISNNTITWNDDNMCYYLVSGDLSTSEMISVAKSLNGTKSVMSTK